MDESLEDCMTIYEVVGKNTKQNYLHRRPCVGPDVTLVGLADLALRIDRQGDPEVAELDVLKVSDYEDVGRLEVAMHQLLLVVKVVQSLGCPSYYLCKLRINKINYIYLT